MVIATMVELLVKDTIVVLLLLLLFSSVTIGDYDNGGGIYPHAKYLLISMVVMPMAGFDNRYGTSET